MYVYVLSFIFMNAEGAYKKYSVCYKTVELAIEYVERDMMSQYGGAFMSTWTDAVKQHIIGSGNYFFRYGENQHYIMIERMEVQDEQPSNIDNVVVFGSSGANTQHIVQEEEKGEEEIVEEPVEETIEEAAESAPEEADEEAVEEAVETVPEEAVEEAAETVPEEAVEEASETVEEVTEVPDESTIGNIVESNSGVNGYSNAPGPESITNSGVNGYISAPGPESVTMNAPVINKRGGSGGNRSRRAKRGVAARKTRKSA